MPSTSTASSMKPVLPREKTYSALALMYRLYVLEEVEAMAEDVDKYLAAFGSMPEAVVNVMKHIPNGGTPTENELKDVTEAMVQQMLQTPVYW